MDVNRTRFHLLLGKDDWAKCTTDEQGEHPLRHSWEASPPNGSGLDWDIKHSELTLQPQLFQFIAAPKDVPPELIDRRGAGRDRYGNWYWIAENRTEIRVNSAGTGTTSHFWSEGDGLECKVPRRFGDFQPKEQKEIPKPLPLSGLTVTEDHYLVAGVLDPAGLLIFDLHAGGPPMQIFWPEGVKFIPLDMAPAPGGGVWVLDRENKRYWALDRHFNVIRQDQADLTPAPEKVDDFQPKDGLPTRRKAARTFPEGISLEASSPVATQDPIAIEALPDGSVLILDRLKNASFSYIYRYKFGRPLGRPLQVPLVCHDFAFVPEGKAHEKKASGLLYIAASDGNQCFAFRLSLHNDPPDMQPLPDFLPMRLFGGKGLVAAGEGVYYDFRNGWIPLIEQKRPRYIPEAALYTPPIDSLEPDCVWHRLMLDACIPPDAKVEIWSRAANEEKELSLMEWQKEPDPYRRRDGSELPYLRNRALKDYGTWELLFQRARGRYLKLKILLSGSGRNTPRLRALRAYYPRFSYLNHYLPAVYREDAQSASFLDRFLANIEGFYTAIEDKIAAAQILFDPQSAPPDALGWLSDWFGIAIDPAWDEGRQRLFIKHAMDFFQYRGTIPGLQMALRLAFDRCADESIFTDPPVIKSQSSAIRIVEKYRTRRAPGVVFGDPTELAGPRLRAPSTRWLPNHGREELQRLYTLFLDPQKPDPGEFSEFPINPPSDKAKADKWQQFSRNTLGFIPSATLGDLEQWQGFLSRRYRRIEILNKAYRFSGSQQWKGFKDVPLPDHLPQDGAPLLDWYQFEGVVLPMHRTAHQFTVLLPLPKEKTNDPEEHRRRYALAERIVNLEKPVHTVFDIKFYWAFFRVGEARLGYDTVLDLGSRATQLMPPMVLGRGALSESYLAPMHPQNVADRQILGRDPLSKPRGEERL